MSIVLAGLVAASAPQGSGSEVVWKWVPEPTSCLLRQDVGDGRFLDVGGRPGMQGVGLSVIDTDARIRTSKTLSSVQFGFSPGETRSIDAYLWPSRDPIGRSIGVTLGTEARAQFTNASAISFAHDEIGTVRVAVRAPAAALDAIRACEDRKLAEWGVDPAAWRTLSAKPTPATPKEKWFSWADYPVRQKNYANDIEVVARLDLAADGSVVKCTVVNRPPEEFVPAACNALMKNARFHPAMDAQGKATPAPYIFQVNFGAIRL